METQAQKKPEHAFYIGQPIYNSLHYKRGYISAITKRPYPMSLIDGNGMRDIIWSIDVIYNDLTRSKDNDEFTIAEQINHPSVTIEPRTVIEMIDMLKAAQGKENNAQSKSMAAHAERQAKEKAFQDDLRDKIPANAKAVIVAELIRCESDYMSDYHGHGVDKVLILAWSTHTRDLFPEMRKAALNAPETVFLHDADKDAEHRQKYSMGGGYFLKNEYRHDNGWSISKRTLCDADQVKSVPMGRYCVNDAPSAPVNNPVSVAGSKLPYTIEAHHHTKKGFDFWICVPTGRLDRDVFNAERERCKSAGGWYSRKWGKSPSGFAFEDNEAANMFASPLNEPPTRGTKPETVVNIDPGNDHVIDKLRTMAHGLKPKIEVLRGDRLANTPKRIAQAAHARLEANNLERVAQVMFILADQREAGTLPCNFRKYTTKKAITAALIPELKPVTNGYYGYSFATGEPHKMADPELWKLAKGKTPEHEKTETLEREIAGLKMSSIPGYFPTPNAVINRMIEYIPVVDGASIADTSAGHGAIIDQLREHFPESSFTAIEINHTLAKIMSLKYKGEDVTVINGNFLNIPLHKFDNIFINPPFEKGADIEHVMHSYDCLNPGGFMVAIMSPSWQTNISSKAREFREWLSSLDHTVEALPDGSFKESGTGVNTVLVAIYAK